jgi:hypothetical protein
MFFNLNGLPTSDAHQVGGIKITPNPEFQRHRVRREPDADRDTDDVLFRAGEYVYYINGIGHIDKREIGTILNQNEHGSLFGQPKYTVKFRNVLDGTERINPDSYQSELVLALPKDLMQGGGKRRKSKHRKSKHRKSKHRKSKHRKSKKSN